MSNSNLDGRGAVIVGGASGMGRATAEALVARGAKVAILDLDRSDGANVAAGLGGTFHPADVRDAEATEVALADALERLGAIHVAVNTAGGGHSARTISRSGPLDLDFFRGIIDLNLIATFNLNRLQAWHMSTNEPDADGGRGVIINTASIAAFEGQIGQVAYTAAKAGIAGMTLTMARDLGGVGIRVMTIAPSLFATGLTAGIPDDMAGGLLNGAAFPHRAGTPEEYASVAMAIVDTPMLNGSTIRLDGGQRFPPK